MQAVGGVAQHHQVGAHLFLGLHQLQRVEVPRTHLLEGAETVAENLLQLVEETPLVEPGKALGVVVRAAPDQRATVFRQGQQGHGAVVGEAFEGLAAMGFQRADVGDERGLPVGGTVHADAQLLAQAGAAAIGQHGEVAVELGLVVEGQAIATFQRLHADHFGRAVPGHHFLVQGLPEALAEPGVLHHVAEGGNALLHGGEAGSAEAPAVGDVDLQYGLGAVGDVLPEAEAFVDLPAAEGQRGRAGVVAGLEAVAGGEGLDQDDLPAPRAGAFLQGQGKAGAHQAAADDRDLAMVHVRRPGCARRPSAPRSRPPSWARRR
ncbi:hypothetical protein D3C84_528400 [compost metagenome]